MTRRQLCEIMQQRTNDDINGRFTYFESFLLNLGNYAEEESKAVKRTLTYLKTEFKRRWSSSRRTDKMFTKKYENWLNGSVELPTERRGNVGCPTKGFEELSDRSKRRRTEYLRENTCADELSYAAHMNHRAEGNVNVSTIIRSISKTPTRAAKYRKAFKGSKTSVTIERHTSSQALAMFVEANLTRKQYEVIQAANKKIYPCYSILKNTKKECYPKAESIRITECSAEIILQDLFQYRIVSIFGRGTG